MLQVLFEIWEKEADRGANGSVVHSQHQLRIPLHRKGEGRDDVFSVLITWWPKALKTVVYDFACVSGPYCMMHFLWTHYS